MRFILTAAVGTLFIMTAPAHAQSVVINKFQNATVDTVELLVVQNGLDMRGMILKDYSSSGTGDNGGSYTFTSDTLWSSVKSGTLIVLRKNNSAADVSAGSGDFSIDVGLANTTYFTAGTGTFDIATSEIVEIKAAGSAVAGSAGHIHSFASGTAATATLFTNAPAPKLNTAGAATTGTNAFAAANNTTGALADFNGSDATGNTTTGYTFGTPNSTGNTTYRDALAASAPVTMSSFGIE